MVLLYSFNRALVLYSWMLSCNADLSTTFRVCWQATNAYIILSFQHLQQRNGILLHWRQHKTAPIAPKNVQQTKSMVGDSIFLIHSKYLWVIALKNL